MLSERRSLTILFDRPELRYRYQRIVFRSPVTLPVQVPDVLVDFRVFLALSDASTMTELGAAPAESSIFFVNEGLAHEDFWRLVSRRCLQDTSHHIMRGRHSD